MQVEREQRAAAEVARITVELERLRGEGEEIRSAAKGLRYTHERTNKVHALEQKSTRKPGSQIMQFYNFNLVRDQTLNLYILL